MNRRNFFKNLLLGAVSAPAVAKVICEEPKPKMVSYGGPRLWVSTPYDPKKLREIVMTWRANGLVYGLDQNPLRFTT